MSHAHLVRSVFSSVNLGERPRSRVLEALPDVPHPRAGGVVSHGPLRRRARPRPRHGARWCPISRTELRAKFAKLAASVPWVAADDTLGTVLGFAHGHTQGRALLHQGRPLHLVALHS